MLRSALEAEPSARRLLEQSHFGGGQRPLPQAACSPSEGWRIRQGFDPLSLEEFSVDLADSFSVPAPRGMATGAVARRRRFGYDPVTFASWRENDQHSFEYFGTNRPEARLAQCVSISKKV
jgi:hypothetical protein